MIEFERYVPTSYEIAKNISVSDSQLPYVGEPVKILALDSDENHVYLIKSHSVITGMFIVDTNYADDYDFALPGELGLRGFVIDRCQQGKGIGVQSVRSLSRFLMAKYPNSASMLLTVNCKNESAYHCYLKGGFIYEGALYHGGSAGPQYILRLIIK